MSISSTRTQNLVNRFVLIWLLFSLSFLEKEAPRSKGSIQIQIVNVVCEFEETLKFAKSGCDNNLTEVMS